VNGVWTEVSSDPVNGDALVWLTTLCQSLLLGLGESPFFANYGIPAQQSVIQQIFPDYYVAQTQSQFAPHFASLIISKLDSPEPHYRVSVTTPVGTQLTREVPI
jgi:hypothetical protein